MEIVAAQPNPDVAGVELEDVIAYGGGVIVGVAALEFISGELEARQVPKWGIAAGQFIGSVGLFWGANRSDGFVRKLLIGAGAGAAAEGVSTTVEVLRGA